MKSKRNTYILLITVLLIWGILIYQFFSFAGKKKIVTESAGTNLHVRPVVIKERESIVINVNYRDPFLGQMYLPANNDKKKSGRRTKLINKEPLLWPSIIYKGIVSDSKDKNKVFMVIINGQTYLMREKEMEQEITLKKGNREFINVTYKGTTNTILIQQ